MLILILSAILVCVMSVPMIMTLPQKELRCFGDNIGQNILVVGSVIANASEYSFKIHIPTRKADGVLHYTHSQNITKFSFTTNHTQQNYQFCLHNLHSQPIQFSYQHATGTDAYDYSLIAQKEDLKPLEIQLKKLNHLANAVEDEYKTLEEKQLYRINYVDKISYRIVVLSIGTLLLMGVVNWFQYSRMKKFFKARKLI